MAFSASLEEHIKVKLVIIIAWTDFGETIRHYVRGLSEDGAVGHTDLALEKKVINKMADEQGRRKRGAGGRGWREMIFILFTSRRELRK